MFIGQINTLYKQGCTAQEAGNLSDALSLYKQARGGSRGTLAAKTYDDPKWSNTKNKIIKLIPFLTVNIVNCTIPLERDKHQNDLSKVEIAVLTDLSEECQEAARGIDHCVQSIIPSDETFQMNKFSELALDNQANIRTLKQALGIKHYNEGLVFSRTVNFTGTPEKILEDSDKAIISLKKATTLFQEIGDQVNEKEVLKLIAKIYEKRADTLTDLSKGDITERRKRYCLEFAYLSYKEALTCVNQVEGKSQLSIRLLLSFLNTGEKLSDIYEEDDECLLLCDDRMNYLNIYSDHVITLTDQFEHTYARFQTLSDYIAIKGGTDQDHEALFACVKELIEIEDSPSLEIGRIFIKELAIAKSVYHRLVFKKALAQMPNVNASQVVTVLRVLGYYHHKAHESAPAELKDKHLEQASQLHFAALSLGDRTSEQILAHKRYQDIRPAGFQAIVNPASPIEIYRQHTADFAETITELNPEGANKILGDLLYSIGKAFLSKDYCKDGHLSYEAAQHFFSAAADLSREKSQRAVNELRFAANLEEELNKILDAFSKSLYASTLPTILPSISRTVFKDSKPEFPLREDDEKTVLEAFLTHLREQKTAITPQAFIQLISSIKKEIARSLKDSSQPLAREFFIQLDQPDQPQQRKRGADGPATDQRSAQEPRMSE